MLNYFGKGGYSSMAKLCKSGRFAVLQEVPHGSKYQHLVGTIGVLEVWESEQSYPGKYGALFLLSLCD